MFGKLLGTWPEKELPRKQSMPRFLRDDAYGQAVIRIGAAETILDKKLLSFQEDGEAVIDAIESLRRHRLIDSPPMNVVLGQGVADYVLVFRRASGKLTGSNH